MALPDEGQSGRVAASVRTTTKDGRKHMKKLNNYAERDVDQDAARMAVAYPFLDSDDAECGRIGEP